MLMPSYLESELFALFLPRPGHNKGCVDKIKNNNKKTMGQSITVLTGGSSWTKREVH